MSNVIRSLIVKVGANTTEFSTAMKNISKDMGDISKNLNKTGRELQKTGATLTKSVTLPIVGIGAAAFKSSVDFESAFAGVRKTVDATEEEFANLSDGIRNMSKELPASAAEIAGVAEAAGQLGIETGNILGFTRVMIDLGEATNMSAEEGAMALARFANITQMSQKDFDKLGSVIVDLGNNLATTESEIVDMGLRLAGAGAQIGMTEAQIMSFAGALSSVGIAAEAGGSAFSKVMINMQLAVETNSEKLQDFAEVAGMTGEEFSKAFKEDAAGALIEFIGGLAKAEEQGSSAIKVLDDIGITEVRMRDALLRASGASDLFTDSIKLGTDAWDENNALTKEAAERYKTTESQMEIARNKMQDVGITIGETLAPHLINLIDKITEVVEWFGNLDQGAQEQIIKMAALAATIGPVISVAGKLTSGLGGLFGTVSKVTKGVSVFSKAIQGGSSVIKALGIALGPGGIVIAGMAAFAAAAVLIYQNWDKITSAVKNAINWVKEFLGINDKAEKSYDIHDFRGSPGSNVQWNAAGAIFTRPTVLPTIAGWQGFGESGAEAVLPLSKLDDILNSSKSEDQLRKIVREEVSNLPIPEVTVVASGSEGELIRYLKFKIDKENKRVGGSLIGGMI